MSFLDQFAETTEPQGDILTALGIDWRLLVLQIVAFVILVFLLGKFVYPWLMKSVDERQAKIDAANKAAAKAQEAAEKNHEQVAELLAQARKEAAEIVSTAKTESSEIAANGEKKAKQVAEQIVNAAHEQIDKDVENVRRQLHDETLELVGLATEKVVGAKFSKSLDNEEIAKAIKAVK